MQITKEIIEELILLYVDKELDEVTAAALLQYVQQHPEYRELLAAYRDTILQPDNDLVFEAKNALKKPAGNSIPFNTSKLRLKIARAAAMIILLTGAGLLTFLLIHQHDQSGRTNNRIAVRPETRPALTNATDTASAPLANSTALNPNNDLVDRKDNASRQSVKKARNAMPNNITTIKPVLPDDNVITKDTIAIGHILPGKIKVHIPEPADSTVLPVIVQADPANKADEMPELAVNDGQETPSSKGLLPGVMNVAGKIFNHKRKTTKLKINIGNNKEYILSFNY